MNQDNNLDIGSNTNISSNTSQKNINQEGQNSLQENNNNPAHLYLNNSARFANPQRSISSGRSSSPPPSSSGNQEKESRLIQRRKSTPSWTVSREVKYIKKDRKKKNVEQMLVVFQNDKNDVGRWINVSELNCPQLIEEYWERKKQMKESNINNANNGEDKQPGSTKKTGNRSIKEIIGMIPSDEYKYIYAVNFNDSTNEEYIPWKEMRKQYPKQLLKYYESHIDQENFTIAPPSSVLPLITDNHQISQQQSQPQIQKPHQLQRHQSHPQSHPHPQQHIQPPPQSIQEQQPNFAAQINEPLQNNEHQPQNVINDNANKVIESENKENTDNVIPIFLKTNQNIQNIPISQNVPISQIHMLQNQVKLQRTSSNPTREPTNRRPSQNLTQIQLIQQNLKMMNKK